MQLRSPVLPEERVAPMEALLTPRAIAVVGASPDRTRPGGRFLLNLERHGYSGGVYPVNRKYAAAPGPRYYADLGAIPAPVDLAVLLTPAHSVAGYIREAAAAGIPAVMICSSGFAESGEEGRALQRELAGLAAQHGIAVLGPNCLGMADLDHGVVASFSNAFDQERRLEKGRIAFVSQSGAMGASVFMLAQQTRIGVSRFISTGNEAVLTFADFLDHLKEDPGVSTILGYVEGLSNGRAFVAAAERARRAGKSVVIVKVGKSDRGAAAAQSHTGAIVSGADIYSAAFRRCGVIECRDIRELTDLASVLPLSVPLRGSRVGIVSSSGGAAVMMTDACADHGLEVPAFAGDTIETLSAILPPFVGYANPVDYGPVYADPDRIEAALHAVARDRGVDVVLFFLGLSPAMAGVIEPRLARVQQRHGKPVFAVWMAGPDGALHGLRTHGVAAFDDVTRAVVALSHLARAGTVPRAPDADAGDPARAEATRRILRAAMAEGAVSLSERRAKALLVPYGVPVAADIAVASADEAERATLAIGGKVVVKAEADDLLHKSEAGAVRLNVTARDAAEAYRAVVAGASRHLGREISAAVVQPMIPPGFEVLLGARRDPQFGPTVSVGLGGVMTEVLSDVVTELAPVSEAIALSMIERLRGARLFGEFRGRPALDRAALARAIVGVSQLAADAGELLAELDVNPVILKPDGEGCVAVDAAAVLSAQNQNSQSQDANDA